MKAWSLKQLYNELENDLKKCTTDHERIMVEAVSGREIREKAEEFSKTRKLTPMELVIAEKYGYNG